MEEAHKGEGLLRSDYKMKLSQFLSICDDKNKLIDYLMEHRVLPSAVRCPSYNNAMDLNRNSLFFRCYNVEYIRNCHKNY